MKKFLLLCLLISFGFNLYLMNTEYVERDDFAEDDSLPSPQDMVVGDQVKLAQSALMKKSPEKCDCQITSNLFNEEKKDKKVQTESHEKIDEENEKMSEDVFREKMEQVVAKWQDKSESFFLDELNLNLEQISQYRELAQNRQTEIDEYFKQKVLHGSNSYIVSTEDTIFMGRVAEKYEKRLMEVFGHENYKKHRSFIKNYNKKMMSDNFGHYVEF